MTEWKISMFEPVSNSVTNVKKTEHKDTTIEKKLDYSERKSLSNN